MKRVTEEKNKDTIIFPTKIDEEYLNLKNKFTFTSIKETRKDNINQIILEKAIITKMLKTFDANIFCLFMGIMFSKVSSPMLFSRLNIETVAYITNTTEEI